MDPVQYQLLQKEINEGIDKLVEIREELGKLYLKLGPAKESVRSIEKEKTRAKRVRKQKSIQKLDEKDSLPQDAEKSQEDNSP